ncbi:enoyl-CoA hydratase/isomerase family protein [Pseudomonas umsongensis]|uniref:enoyl-CoA hydratase/isomerase family protein n=1 Tax=Pseudomonas umsongensis TaxID=198618 RepID=UPI00200B71F5|nr:enoyl-CoA hydratase-related protein [Pseudomonas umsongensis]MCK8683271.1 enoyl-CoA hydratase-related protein [Pseudomonas umsongensis]
MSDIIKYVVVDRIATLTLNRPEVRNALSPELIEALIKQFRAADSDPQVKCIVIQGEGEHFCGGGDVKGFGETLTLSAEERFTLYERKLLVGSRLPNLLLEASKPVVVKTRGAVAGAGLALCLAADFVVSGESSFFLAAHVHIGLSLDSGLSGLLVAAMGIKEAKRLTLLGERIDTQEALRLGVISQAVPDTGLDAAVSKLAQRLAEGPAVAMAASKALLNHAAYRGFSEQLAEEAVQVARCAADKDFDSGIRAVLEHKRPTFD